MAVDATTIRLPVRSANNSRTVAKDIIEVAEADYKYVLRSIAAQEIAQQRSIKNRVTHLIVDGTGSKPITEANFSVRAWFVQPSTIIKAAREAWEVIHRVARIGDPLSQTVAQRPIIARARFALVIGQTFIGDPGSLTEQHIMSHPRQPIRIVGPLVEYARYYRFMFLQKGARRLRTTRRRTAAGTKIRVPISIHEDTIRQMRRRFPMLRWSDDWMPVARLRYIDRVPTVSIRQRTTKGAL